MKTILLNLLKIRSVILLGLIFILSPQVKGGEFVLMNGEITFGTGDNGFSRLITDFSSYPSNWVSPDDYFHGQIYTYYEVIDVPTNEPFKMQFGIFQKYPNAAEWDGHTYAERCENIRSLQGVGSHWIGNSSPSNWWSSPEQIDFARVSDFHSLGAVLYGTIPGNSPESAPLNPTSGGGDDAIWDARDNWLPCTIKVIAVAVSSGSVFSGWNNYLEGSLTQQPTPTYEIDFGYERTDAIVPSSDEYSIHSDMSGAVSGTGQRVYLTPGLDLYFRTKAGDGLDASEVQHLVVPDRPATPSFLIDYVNEETMQIVSTAIAYSVSSSFTDPVDGTNARISLTPGQDLYFRTRATSGSFASEDYHLVVPDRPAVPDYQINSVSAKTVQPVVPEDEYSAEADLSGAQSGTSVALDLTPGTDLYFRTKATGSSFRSDIQHLVVDQRPEAPAFTIDFEGEMTSEIVANTIEYSASSDMSGPSTGTGTVLSIIPGQDLYFRTKATASSFSSLVYHLDVPARPTLAYVGEDTITTETFAVSAILDESMSGFGLSDLMVTNGLAQNLHGENMFDVVPESVGEVQVIIPFNTFNGASFASNVVVVYYKVITGIPQIKDNVISIYPNPSSDGLIHISNKQTKSYSVEVLSVDGSLVRTLSVNGSESQLINLQDLKKGIYFLKINSNGIGTLHKLILQ